jgi:hypothetical protein
MSQSQEYLKREFMHYIGDTIALLGADEEFVRKIKSLEEKPFTSEIIDEIRKFNVEQTDKVKTRLALLNTTTAKTRD